MRWAHVIYSSDKIKANVPLNFIENYDSIQIQESKKYYVFWSPNENESPESVLESQGKLMRVEKIKKSAKILPLSGYYQATVLLLAGKFYVLYS